MNWICSDNWPRGLSTKRNCLSDWYQVPSTFKQLGMPGYMVLETILIGIVLTIDFRDWPRTNATTGRVDRNWTTSGGKAPWPGFLIVGELAQVPHYPETMTSPGGYLDRAWSFGIKPGRHAHEPGSSSASCCCNGSVGSIDTHVSDTWKCGSYSFLFTHPPGDKKKKRVPSNWKCLNNWCLVVSVINWSCPDKWSRKLYVEWNCPSKWSRGLSIN